MNHYSMMAITWAILAFAFAFTIDATSATIALFAFNYFYGKSMDKKEKTQ